MQWKIKAKWVVTFHLFTINSHYKYIAYNNRIILQIYWLKTITNHLSFLIFICSLVFLTSLISYLYCFYKSKGNTRFIISNSYNDLLLCILGTKHFWLTLYLNQLKLSFHFNSSTNNQIFWKILCQYMVFVQTRPYQQERIF